MSTEEKAFGVGPRAEAPTRPRRTPIATADGSQAAKSLDAGAASGRRRRVRISTSDVVDQQRPSGSYGTKRFNNRFPDRGYNNPNTRDEYSSQGYQRHRSSQGTQQGEIDPFNRVDYEQRYQNKRAEGSYDYNYNRSEEGAGPRRPRPQQGAGDNYAGKPNKKKMVKKPKKVFKPIEPVKYKEEIDPTKEVRLNKFLANAGVCSRREADELIQKGEVFVNGVAVTELGTRVTYQDEVVYNGKRVERESKVYVLLNKPKNCVTTSDDPECRLTVMDIVRNACPERIYPVGRLDRHTTGVLLITNDGDLASKLTHPSFLKKKIYHVWLNKPVAMEDMQKIADGIELEDGEIHADALSYVKDDDLSQVGIEIHSGRNRIVRRIFEHLGYKVIKLDRVYFAGLTKKNLPRGRWRYLNEDEVNALRMGAFE